MINKFNRAEAPAEKQPEALFLADALKRDHDANWPDFGNAEAAIEELRRLHAENDALRTGYDAARLEIASLQARIAELEAARFAYASEFAPTPDGDPDVGIIHANIRALKTLVASLHTQMESVGAGGMEPLRKAVEAEREMCANLCEQQRFGIDAFGTH